MAVLLTFFSTEKTVIFYFKKTLLLSDDLYCVFVMFSHSEKKHYFSVMVCTVFLLMFSHSEKKHYFSVMG